MAVRHIPPKSTRRWTGPYLGDYYGELWKTYNIDLDRCEGIVSLSQRMQRIEDSGEFGGLIHPIAFIRTDADCEDRYWGLASGGGLVKTDSASSPLPNNDWDTDALDSSPVKPLDWTIHLNDTRGDTGRNKLLVTTDTGGIAVLNDCGGNNWNKNFNSLTLDTTVPFHPIEFFPFQKISLVGDGNKIHTVSRVNDTSNDTVSVNRITLPSSYVARHIFTTSDRAWILCYNKLGGDGIIAEWDGFSQSEGIN